MATRGIGHLVQDLWRMPANARPARKALVWVVRVLLGGAVGAAIGSALSDLAGSMFGL